MAARPIALNASSRLTSQLRFGVIVPPVVGSSRSASCSRRGNATCSCRASPTEQLTFEDHRFEHKSTSELPRSLLVLRLCTSPLSHHGPNLLRAQPWLAASCAEHFTAGAERADAWAQMNKLKAHGLSAILDAADPFNPPVGHLHSLLAAINTASAMPTQGFAIVRPRRLADPEALRRTASALAAGAPLDDAERQCLASMDQRLQQLAQHAATRGVKLLLEDLDGPHLGPVLSALLPPLLRAVNSVGAEALAAGRPAAPAEARLFLPYAVGAAGALQRLTRDLETAQSEGYVLGAKLVGNGSDAPSTWSACLERLLEAAQAGRAEVMLAAARRGEVEAAVAALARAGLSPEAAPVAFVQPLGVADHLGFSLGRHGYRVYKTCPYGKAEDVRPALLQHMQDASWASHEDARLAQAELWSRLLSDPLAAAAARVLGARQQRSSAGASGGRSDANQPMAS